MAYYVNASAVAAVIGANPYKDADAAFLDILERAPQWKPVIDDIKAGTGKCTDAELYEAVVAAAPAVQVAVEQGIAAAVAATSDGGVAAAIDVAAATAAASVDASQRVLVLQGVTQAVTIARGQVMEAATLDAYEESAHATVSQRNTHMMYLRTKDYVIGGRIDGFDAAKNCVVEVKNRRHARATVPAYDLIQLRVYLQIVASQRGAVPGVTGMLVEQFPDGQLRNTEIVQDESEWEPVHTALVKVAARYAATTRDVVAALITKCSSSTWRPVTTFTGCHDSTHTRRFG